MKRTLALVLCTALASALVSLPPVFAQATTNPGLINSVTVTTFYTHESAETLYRQAKYAQAEAMCKAAITDLTKSKGEKSPAIAEPLIDLATLYMRQAKFADAKEAIDRADALLDKSKPEQALVFGRLGINKGWRLYILGETSAAAKVCQDSIDALQKNNVKESKDLAELINNLGLMNDELADESDDPRVVERLMTQARVNLFKGKEMRESLTGKESPETGESLNNIGMHLLFNGRSIAEVDTGYRTLQESLAVARKVYGENHPETAVSHATYALALYMDGKVDEAEKELRIAMPITEKYLGKMHPDRAYELRTFGMIMIEQNNFSEAEKNFDEMVKINEHVYGKTSPHVLPSLKVLHDFYESRGDTGKARDVEKRIDGIRGKDI